VNASQAVKLDLWVGDGEEEAHVGILTDRALQTSLRELEKALARIDSSISTQVARGERGQKLDDSIRRRERLAEARDQMGHIQAQLRQVRRS